MAAAAGPSVEKRLLTSPTYLAAYAVIVWYCGLLDRSDKQRLLAFVRRDRARHTTP